MKQKLFFLFRILCIGLGIFLCLKYAEECSRGIRNGILFCIQVLVPSLFFMMVLSAYLIKSGTAERIARPLDGLSRKLFRLPYPSLAVIILAMIGGYPVGARCAEMLYEDGKLSEGDAERTAYTGSEADNRTAEGREDDLDLTSWSTTKTRACQNVRRCEERIHRMRCPRRM